MDHLEPNADVGVQELRVRLSLQHAEAAAKRSHVEHKIAHQQEHLRRGGEHIWVIIEIQVLN